MSWVIVDDDGVLQVRGSVTNETELNDLVENLQRRQKSYFTKGNPSGESGSDIHPVPAVGGSPGVAVPASGATFAGSAGPAEPAGRQQVEAEKQDETAARGSGGESLVGPAGS